MKVLVLFFATLKDKVGQSKVEMELPEASDVASFKRALFDLFPNLPKVSSTLLVAINKEFAFDTDPIPADAEIAVFPPVSGGNDLQTFVSVTENELDLNALVAQIILPTTGATCFFSGVVRGQTSRDETQETTHLVYEAYVPMAEAKMRQVATEIRERWPQVEGIAIVQRVGKLMPGTPTVLIACSAGHRNTGVFEAARYGIDRLKEVVPIWKKEVGPGGEEWVVGEYIPNPADENR